MPTAPSQEKPLNLSELRRKWAPVVEAGDKLTDKQADLVALAMEVESRFLCEFSEDERQKEWNKYLKFVFPVVRRVVIKLAREEMPSFKTIVDDICTETMVLSADLIVHGKLPRQTYRDFPTRDEVKVLAPGIAERIQMAFKAYQGIK